MTRAVLALLLLIAVIAGYSGDALAHAGMAGHGTVVTDEAVPVSGAAAVPADADRSSGHLPAGKCCMAAAGCGSAGSIPAGAPLLPLPEQVSTVELVAILDTPRSLELPVADRPPRST